MGLVRTRGKEGKRGGGGRGGQFTAIKGMR